MSGTNIRKRKKYQYQAFLWLLPAIILLGVFSYYPPIRTFILSFTDANGSGTGEFIYFQNYFELFRSEVFWKSVKNVILFITIGIIAGNFMTILFAEMLYNLRNKRLASGFRFLFITPILVPSIVIIMIWRYIVFAGGEAGIANQLIGLFGIENQNWYYDVLLAPIIIILTNFPWVAGTSFLIYLAGFQSISKEVIEASKIDGANTIQRIFKIDLPLVRGQIKYFIVMGIIGGLQNINMQLLVTGSGPGTSNATNVPAYMLFENAFSYDRYGYASAIGIVIFIVTLIITIFNMKKVRGSNEG